MRFLLLSIVAACSAPSSSEPPGSPDAPDAGATNGGADAAAVSDASPLVTCTGKSTQPRDATWMVGGRRVRVHVPASYDPARGTAVVINLHGYAGDGQEQARISKMNARADAAGFVAVYPDGHHLPRGWNGGVCCGSAASSGTDDTAWISGVIDALGDELCVDPDRVYATGLSNGGFMAHRLGCELADRIAAIGAVAGVVGISTCNPSRPVPVFHVHGTSDGVIPYGGGGVNGNEAVATTIERWRTRNGCTGAGTTTYGQGDATCVTYDGCTAGADVTLCTIDGGGHQWPGGESIGVFSGKLSDDLDATGAMWEFFAAHPR